MIGVIVHAVALNTMLLLPVGKQNHNMLYVLMFLTFIEGLFLGTTQSVGFCYLCEIAPTSYSTMSGSIWSLTVGLL